jgi:hypothetical protein
MLKHSINTLKDYVYQLRFKIKKNNNFKYKTKKDLVYGIAFKLKD